jgi:hypothetical protein
MVRVVLGRQKHRQQSHLCQSSAPEVEIAVGKLKRYTSPGVDQIPAELIQSLFSEFHKLIDLVWNIEEVPHQ